MGSLFYLGCFTLLTATSYTIRDLKEWHYFLFKLSRIYHFNKSRLHYIGIILRVCLVFFVVYCSAQQYFVTDTHRIESTGKQ